MTYSDTNVFALRYWDLASQIIIGRSRAVWGGECTYRDCCREYFSQTEHFFVTHWDIHKYLQRPASQICSDISSPLEPRTFIDKKAFQANRAFIAGEGMTQCLKTCTRKNRKEIFFLLVDKLYSFSPKKYDAISRTAWSRKVSLNFGSLLEMNERGRGFLAHSKGKGFIWKIFWIGSREKNQNI